MKGLNNKENLMSQYGGPDGELSASLRYQNQTPKRNYKISSMEITSVDIL